MVTGGSAAWVQYAFLNLLAGMILQRRDAERGYVVWRDYQVDGEVVESPVDIDTLPSGVYRLVE